MIRFECDYSEGAHPAIIEKLYETNMLQTVGYGVDEFCDKARELIKKVCENDDIFVHFLVGGTQTNSTFIDSVLKSYQGVISASTGHIAVHESGTIEASGHKVLTIPSDDGKITAEAIDELYCEHFENSTHEHEVQPGMVYFSFPTENGTIYSMAELEAISAVCKKRSLPLFIDGARMGYGLMSEKNDLTLNDFTKLCDAFYIGGTKQGFLFGEALVITNAALNTDFRYMIKQHGGMLAKGRLLGVQYLAMLETDLYFTLAKKADEQAMRIRNAFLEKGYKLRYDSYTNQQFPIVENSVLERLSEKYAFSVWGKHSDSETVVRFCTSWATRDEWVDELISDI